MIKVHVQSGELHKEENLIHQVQDDDVLLVFFFSSRRRHTRYWRDWSSDVCSSDLEMMSLDADGTDDITLYINSPGGIVSGMFAIYDVMHLLNSKVNTVCVGMAASAAAFLLATASGKRAATPNARIMFHQPLGGARGQAVDIQIQAQQIVFLRERLNEILAERTGQPLERIRQDTDRDFWLSAEDAVGYGAIDEVRSRGGV